MEEQPSFEPRQGEDAQGRVPDFVKRLGRVLAISLIGAVLYALILGPRNTSGLANGLFLIGTLLLLISLLPLLSDIFNRATVTFRMEGHSLEEIIEEARGREQQGETNTYLFGISGMIIVALSLLLGFV